MGRVGVDSFIIRDMILLLLRLFMKYSACLRSWGVCFTYGVWFGLEAFACMGHTFQNGYVIGFSSHIDVHLINHQLIFFYCTLFNPLIHFVSVLQVCLCGGEACLWVPAVEADGGWRLGRGLWVMWAAALRSEQELTDPQHLLGFAGVDGC